MQIELQDILVSDEYQKEIQDSFAYATGFGVAFIDNLGRTIGPGSNFTRFCRCINDDAYGCRCCTMSNCLAIEIALRTKKPSIFICHAGLVNIEIPLIYEGQHVGGVTAGQVLCDDMSSFPRDTVNSSIDWLEKPNMRQYFSEIKVLTRQQIEAATQSLFSISNYIVQRVAYGKSQKELMDKENELLILSKKKTELEHLLMQAKFDALQKQVTPHFIFNVINSVSRLIDLSEYDTAQEMLIAFSKMLRYSLTGEQSVVTLSQELDYIKGYLSIQKIRFGERLNYDLYCDDTMLNLELPFFSIQPLVENSIEHGVLSQTRGGWVRLICRAQEDGYCIRLSDSGVGIGAEKLTEIKHLLFDATAAPAAEHIGIYNCFNRLKLLFGDRLDFRIESDGNSGTVISIHIARA